MYSLFGFVILLIFFGFAFSATLSELRKGHLSKKYGDSDKAKAIIGREIFVGMYSSELEDAWGSPDAREQSVGGGRVRETWLYGKSGRGYSSRVYLEGSQVIGWKQRR